MRSTLALMMVVSLTTAATQAPPAASGEAGDPASREVVAKLQEGLAEAIQRFEAMDMPGVLRYVSDRYRSGPLTKPLVREQLQAMFSLHDRVWARVRIDEVRMIGDRAWVYSTGDVTGRVRLLGTIVPLLAWERAPEVAWLEDGRWRLIGDRQP